MATKSPLKIVIAYENLDAGVRAKKISERVAAQLDLNFKIQSDLYKFDFLDHPQLREEASLQACSADLIIIATDDPGELPGHVKSWMEDWLPARRKGQSALVALIGKEDADSWAGQVTRDYLQQMAERGHMDFFCQTVADKDVPQPGQRPKAQHVAPRFAECTSDARWTGWGLNE